MLNSYIRLRPFLTAMFGVFLLSTPAFAARDGSTDRPGLDYKTIELSAPNPDLCENACKKDGKCRAWTYSWPGAKGPKAMCALKTGVPPKRSDTCCISGVLSTSSPVTRTDDPAPEPKKPVETAKPKPVPAPAPKKPVARVEPAPAPEVKPEKPVQAVKPKREKPAERTAVQPLPAPLPPVDEQETVTVTPAPKPNLRPRLDDETDRQPERTPDPEIPSDSRKVAACNDYADRAVVQNRENNRLACGLSGNRWGFGRQAYFSFCMRNPSSVYNAARAERDRDLDTCKRRFASRNTEREEPILPDVDVAEPDDIIVDNTRSARFCRNFAGQSVRQARQARRLRCGFGGERWSFSRVRQAQLCRRIGPRAATDLLNTRARQIENCRVAGFDRGPSRSHCREYARTAVQQAREARRLDCGYGGRRWSRSYQRHLRWCSSTSESQARREYRRRERLLDRCE